MAVYAEVEGVGRLEFPDGTDPAVIQKTVKNVIARRNQAQQPSDQAQQPSDQAQPSTFGAMARAAERSILPTVAGFVGGAAATPETGGIAAIPAAIASSLAASKAQEMFFEAHPEIAKALGQDPETVAADIKAHPVATSLTELGSSLIGMRPSAAGVKALAGIGEEAAVKAARQQAVAGMALAGGIDVGTQLGFKGIQNFSPTEAIGSAVLGAVAHKPTAFGEALQNVGQAARRTAIGAFGPKAPIETGAENVPDQDIGTVGEESGTSAEVPVPPSAAKRPETPQPVAGGLGAAKPATKRVITPEEEPASSLEGLSPEERAAVTQQRIRSSEGQEEEDQQLQDRLDNFKNKFGETYEDFKQKYQNVFNASKNIEDNLERKGKLIVAGPDANNLYGVQARQDSIFNDFVKRGVDPKTIDLMVSIGDYAKNEGITAEQGLNEVGNFLKALHAPERSEELVRRYMPLSTDVVPDAAGSETGLAPSQIRKNSYEEITKIAGDLNIPKQERLDRIASLKDLIDSVVADPSNRDPFGESYYPKRIVEKDGSYNPLPTDTSAGIYQGAAGMHPEEIAEVTKILNNKLADDTSGALLQNIFDKYNNLLSFKKDLDKTSGDWSEWLDDIASGLYQWKHYAPLKAKEGEIDPTDLEGTRNLGGVAGWKTGMEGGRHITENPITQLIYDAGRSADKASKGGVTLRVKNLIDSGELDGEKLGTVSAADRFLNPEFEDANREYLGGDKIYYQLPNGDTEVYRVDDENVLNGLRRPYQEASLPLRFFRNATSLLSQQFTRLRLAFAPANFVKHTMDNMNKLPINTLGGVLPHEYAGEVAKNLSTGNGFKMFKLSDLYNSGDQEALQNFLDDNKDNQFVQDAYEWMKNGGMATYASTMKINDLANHLKTLMTKPVGKRVLGAMDDLLENWNRSWDLTSRVSAYRLVKANEMQKPDMTDEAAQQTATKVAKDLANFSLSGEKSQWLKAMYAFWGPEATTTASTIDAYKKAFWSDDHIDNMVNKILKPAEQENPELVNDVRNRLRAERYWSRMGWAMSLSMGAFMYGLKQLWTKSMFGDDYRPEKEGRSIEGLRLPIDKDTVLNLPFGFGSGNVIGLGYHLASLANGSQTPKEYAENTSKIMTKFLPLQLADINPVKDFFPWLADSIAPTVLKLPTEIAMNKDSLGHTIFNAYPSKVSEVYGGGSGVPDHYKDFAIWAHKNLNVDMSPNILYSLMTNYFDSVNDLIGSGTAIKNALQGDKIKPIAAKPFLGTFISRKSDADAVDYLSIKDQMLPIGQKINDPDPEYRNNFIKNNMDQVRAFAVFKSESEAIRKLEAARKQISQSVTIPKNVKQERLQMLNDRIDAIQRATVLNVQKYGIDP